MWYKTGKFFFWLFFKLFCGLEVKGGEFLPKKGGFILVSNHVSNLDPVVLGVASSADLNFMAKEELFSNRFAGWVLRRVHAFPLKRKGADLSAVRTAIKRVDRGGALLIFPEGTRSSDGQLGRGREGIGFLVEKLNVPVIPAYISGTAKVMAKGSAALHPSKISVHFGKQILLERRLAYTDVAQTVMQAIKQLSCCG